MRLDAPVDSCAHPLDQSFDRPLDRLLDRAVDRRTIIHACTALAATAAVSAFGGPATGAAPRLPGDPFTLGVASGDPRPYSVVLWTRLAPEPLAADGGMPHRTVNVDWQVATDPRMREVVRRGTVRAVPRLAHAVHAEVDGLAPGRRYYYRFRAGGEVSPIGRTRTAPDPRTTCPSLAFAFASCQKVTATGRYAAYDALAGEDGLDLLIHLGDYIYDEPDTGGLADYRRLYATTKRSPDLRAAHAALPFVTTFDDHEVRDNYAGDHARERADRPGFARRRAAAYRAYYEHQPVRVSALPRGPRIRMHRRLTYADLVTFHVLDTRQYRTFPPYDERAGGPFVPAADAVDEPHRSMLGRDQTRWLQAGLNSSRSRWNVLAQQAMMARYDYGDDDTALHNLDGWDGCPAARRRLLAFLHERRVDNPVVISGDMHANFVADLTASGRASGEPVAPELVGTSISSPPRFQEIIGRARDRNPHVRHHNGVRRGYVRCDVTAERWLVRLREVRDPAARSRRVRTQAIFTIEDGAHAAERLA